MKFWTEDRIAAAREIVQAADTHQKGYVLASQVLGTTVNAVFAAMKRYGVVGGGSQAVIAQQPPQDLLDSYHRRLQANAEKTRIKALETDLYTLRKTVEAFTAITSTPLAPIARREILSGKREAASVALLSDVHCEERVRIGETPVGNEYNTEIAAHSLARFFAGYRWLLGLNRTAFTIRDVTLWIGGDLMSGHIHDELKETTDKTPIQSILWLRSHLVAGIDSLLEDPLIEHLHVPCSYGNHGRNTMKPYRARGAAHSYEWMLYQWLASHYEGNKRVTFLADESAHQYQRIYNWDLHYHHGDETSYGGGVGGVLIPLNKATSQWDKAKRCHYHNFGHWHQYLDTEGVTVNGSVIGYNAYAMSIKATPEDPRQAFYLVDSKRGKTAKYPIWVREEVTGA